MVANLHSLKEDQIFGDDAKLSEPGVVNDKNNRAMSFVI